MDGLGDDLARRGIASWNIEYRRVGEPGGGWPGTLDDVARAADHLPVLAGQHPLDLARVVTLGHSAGGHLALWLAARPRIPAGLPGAAPPGRARRPTPAPARSPARSAWPASPTSPRAGGAASAPARSPPSSAAPRATSRNVTPPPRPPPSCPSACRRCWSTARTMTSCRRRSAGTTPRPRERRATTRGCANSPASTTSRSSAPPRRPGRSSSRNWPRSSRAARRPAQAALEPARPICYTSPLHALRRAFVVCAFRSGEARRFARCRPRRTARRRAAMRGGDQRGE